MDFLRRWSLRPSLRSVLGAALSLLALACHSTAPLVEGASSKPAPSAAAKTQATLRCEAGVARSAPGRLVVQSGHTGEVSHLSLRDGYLASGSPGEIRLWDVRSMALVGTIYAQWSSFDWSADHELWVVQSQASGITAKYNSGTGSIAIFGLDGQWISSIGGAFEGVHGLADGRMLLETPEAIVSLAPGSCEEQVIEQAYCYGGYCNHGSVELSADRKQYRLDGASEGVSDEPDKARVLVFSGDAAGKKRAALPPLSSEVTTQVEDDARIYAGTKQGVVFVLSKTRPAVVGTLGDGRAQAPRSVHWLDGGFVTFHDGGEASPGHQVVWSLARGERTEAAQQSGLRLGVVQRPEGWTVAYQDYPRGIEKDPKFGFPLSLFALDGRSEKPIHYLRQHRLVDDVLAINDDGVWRVVSTESSANSRVLALGADGSAAQELYTRSGALLRNGDAIDELLDEDGNPIPTVRVKRARFAARGPVALIEHTEGATLFDFSTEKVLAETGPIAGCMLGQCSGPTAVTAPPRGGQRERGGDCRVDDPGSGGTIIMTLSGLSELALSARGSFVAARYLSSVQIKDVRSREVVRRLDVNMPKGEEVSAFALRGDGSELLFGTSAGDLLLELDGALVRVEGSGGFIEKIVPTPDGRRALSVARDGTMTLWDLEHRQLVAVLAEFDDGEHLATTPRGAYSGSAEASRRIAWVFDGPVEAFRFDQFSADFDQPNTVAARLRGDIVDASQTAERPPTLTLLGSRLSEKGDLVLDVSANSPFRVAELVAFREGRRSSEQNACDEDARASLRVPLLAGVNTVEVQGFDARGAASNPLVVEARGPASGRRPKLWVLALGVSSYPQLPPRFQLDYADDDARGIAAAFAAHAGDGGWYSGSDVRVLVDDQVTPGALSAGLERMRAMAPDDVAVVFFAGHGVKANDAATALLTSRAGATSSSMLDGSIDWGTMSKTLTALPGRVLVLLDACHSGHFSEGVVANAELARSLSTSGRSGLLVFAAAKGRQFSYEPAGTRGLRLTREEQPRVTTAQPHGYFTGALIRALSSKEANDHNADGVIQVSELLADVERRVSGATKGKQTPWIVRREGFGDYGVGQTE